jgi:hypothetical protein
MHEVGGAKTEHQIDDLAAHESMAPSRDGADAKESTDTRKGDGNMIGPAAYRCTLRRRGRRVEKWAVQR